MIKKKATRKRGPKAQPAKIGLLRRLRRRLAQAFLVVVGFGLLWIILYSFVRPPTTPYMVAEGWRQGAVRQTWVRYDQIAPVMVRSVVAAEDANFCLHWGVDMSAIRLAIDQGSNRGASTITQQVVKNAYLWQGRSYLRKALEALMTPFVEVFWSKRRILEVYLNVAEFDRGVFGVEAAAQWYFGTSAAKLSPAQAARLAVILPNPKERSAKRPSSALRKKAAEIMDGAETIRRDGRSACFED